MLNKQQREILPVDKSVLARAMDESEGHGIVGTWCKYVVRYAEGWATALLDLKEAQGVLKKVEWGNYDIGGVLKGLPIVFTCPSCHRSRVVGHAPDCKLAKVLGEGEKDDG